MERRRWWELLLWAWCWGVFLLLPVGVCVGAAFFASLLGQGDRLDDFLKWMEE